MIDWPSTWTMIKTIGTLIMVGAVIVYAFIAFFAIKVTKQLEDNRIEFIKKI